jgi:hypothetical protein
MGEAHRWRHSCLRAHSRFGHRIAQLNSESDLTPSQGVRTPGHAEGVPCKGARSRCREYASGKVVAGGRQENGRQVLVFVMVRQLLEKRELGDVIATPVIRAIAPPLIGLELIED